MTTAKSSHATATVLADDEVVAVRATLPLVAQHIDAISAMFYQNLFAAHPELGRDLFNRGNQSGGTQSRAFGGAITAFARHLIDPHSAHPAKLMARVSRKHSSLGVSPGQYTLLHTHLFAAIVNVLGAETVTAPVAHAWSRVYWIMARTLIDLEAANYSAADIGAAEVFRAATVIARNASGEQTTFTLAGSGIVLPEFTVGQSISVAVLAKVDGARQIRAYPVVSCPVAGQVTFAVNNIPRAATWPVGEVTLHLLDYIIEGSDLEVSVLPAA